jgi:hypothetical protein
MARKLRGNTTMGMVNAGISERNAFKPKIGTTSTIGTPITGTAGTPIKGTMIGSSYGNIVGGSGGLEGKGMGGGGFGGGLPSMGQLEGASMRLADAASKRNISEKQAESEMSAKLAAKAAGFGSADEMSQYTKKKREESDKEEKKAKYEEEMRKKGFVLIGGRWVKRTA